jgi:hypothetical protein
VACICAYARTGNIANVAGAVDWVRTTRISCPMGEELMANVASDVDD